MRAALVTTCRGRLAHLEQTLPHNLSAISDNSIAILVNYGSPDGLPYYIAKYHKKDLDSGKLVYYEMPDRTEFHMAHAKNVAHRCGMLEDASILVNVDADNYCADGFSEWVKNKFQAALDDSEAIFLGAKKNHRGTGELASIRTPRGTFGRIACSVQGFRHAGGYDEIFSSWSPDDKDYGMRLTNLGYSWHRIRPIFLRAIQHGANPKGEYALKRQMATSEEEIEILEERKHLGVVNGGHIGCGIVYRNFSSSPIEIKPLPTRVFGIGLHKTGTTSLAQAFRKLGWDSAHWISDHWARNIWNEMKSGHSPTLEMHYALCDLPIPLLYKDLDRMYPGAKFILTLRDEDDWINSVKVHWSLRESWDRDSFSNFIHKKLYGTTEFDEQVFRYQYRAHNEDVKEHFRSRPNDLLVINVKKARMSDLQNFFGLPTYDAPFPHKHKSAEQPKYKL